MQIDEHLKKSLTTAPNGLLKEIVIICLQSAKQSIQSARTLFDAGQYTHVNSLLVNSIEEQGKAVIIGRVSLYRQIGGIYPLLQSDLENKINDDLKSFYDHKSKYRAGIQSSIASTSQSANNQYQANLQAVYDGYLKLRQRELQGLYSDLFEKRNKNLYVNLKHRRGGKIEIIEPLGLFGEVSQSEIDEIGGFLIDRENIISKAIEEVERNFGLTTTDIQNLILNIQNSEY